MIEILYGIAVVLLLFSGTILVLAAWVVFVVNYRDAWAHAMNRFGEWIIDKIMGCSGRGPHGGAHP